MPIPLTNRPLGWAYRGLCLSDWCWMALLLLWASAIVVVPIYTVQHPRVAPVVLANALTDPQSAIPQQPPFQPSPSGRFRPNRCGDAWVAWAPRDEWCYDSDGRAARVTPR